MESIREGEWRKQALFFSLLKSLENKKNRAKFIQHGALHLMQRSLLENPDTYNLFEEFSVIYFLTLEKEGQAYAVDPDVKWVRYATLMLKRFMRPDSSSELPTVEPSRNSTRGNLFSRHTAASKATTLDQVN